MGPIAPKFQALRDYHRRPGCIGHRKKGSRRRAGPITRPRPTHTTLTLLAGSRISPDLVFQQSNLRGFSPTMIFSFNQTDRKGQHPRVQIAVRFFPPPPSASFPYNSAVAPTSASTALPLNCPPLSTGTGSSVGLSVEGRGGPSRSLETLNAAATNPYGIEICIPGSPPPRPSATQQELPPSLCSIPKAPGSPSSTAGQTPWTPSGPTPPRRSCSSRKAFPHPLGPLGCPAPTGLTFPKDSLPRKQATAIVGFPPPFGRGGTLAPAARRSTRGSTSYPISSRCRFVSFSHFFWVLPHISSSFRIFFSTTVKQG